MGYEELKGTDQEAEQSKLKKVLDREDTVVMIVLGADQKEVAKKAKEVADEEFDTWWVVWVQNPGLLTDGQISKYTGNDSKTVVCALSATRQPVRRLPAENAQFKDQLLSAFLEAQAAG